MFRSPSELIARLIDERDLTPAQDAAIRLLLVKSFPADDADYFQTCSYWGPRPTHRLVIEDQDDNLVAHLDLEVRTIQVGDQDVLVAGVGEVATDPGLQGNGVGRRLMTALQHVMTTSVPVSYGVLQCGDQVVGFYKATGWQQIHVPVQAIHPESQQWETVSNHVMIAPGLKSITDWPDGAVNLRGLLW